MYCRRPSTLRSITAAAVSLVSRAAWIMSSSGSTPVAPVHSSAARAISMGQPLVSSNATSRGASPARRMKCAKASARSLKDRMVRVCGVVMEGESTWKYGGYGRDGSAGRAVRKGGPRGRPPRRPPTAQGPPRLRRQLALPLHPDDPQPAVHVGNVHIPVPVDRPPGVGHVGGRSLLVAGVHMGHLAPL